jgi:NagD protein
MDTDILGGIQLGYTTILTLTGVSKKEDLIHFAFKPDLIVKSVADIDLDAALSLK